MNTKFMVKSHYKNYLWFMIKFHHKKMWQKFIFNKKLILFFSNSTKLLSKEHQ